MNFTLYRVEYIINNISFNFEIRSLNFKDFIFKCISYLIDQGINYEDGIYNIYIGKDKTKNIFDYNNFIHVINKSIKLEVY